LRKAVIVGELAASIPFARRKIDTSMHPNMRQKGRALGGRAVKRSVQRRDR
jgi:hypothetical protein